MKRQSVLLGVALAVATLFIVHDASAQYRRYPPRPYPGGYYGGPRVSVGIGGVFGVGRWGYYGGPRVGVSVMLPPIVIGSRMRDLPPDARRVYYGGETYYYRNNTYYRERERGDGYEVVEPPLGASLQRIPAASRKREINGNTYYEYNGTYYMRNDNNDDDGRFIVVGKRGRLDTDEALRQRDTYREDRDYNDGYNRRERGYEDDGYSNRRAARDNEEVVVRNANDDYEREITRTSPARSNTNQNQDEVYAAGPQVGDRFESLPRNTKTITVGGQTQYESPAGTRYKEVNENGKTVYEVTKGR